MISGPANLRQAIRWLILACAIAGTVCAEPAVQNPQRIASLNLCTDQILLELVEPERLVSLTYLSSQPAYSPHWQLAQTIPANRGLAEELVPLQPDLILTTEYASKSARRMLEKLGYPVTVIELPQTLAGLDEYVQRIATLTGTREKARTLMATLHSELATLQSLAPSAEQHRPGVIIYAPNGHTAGARTLKGEIAELAGFRNLAGELGITHYGSIGLEQLLRLQPEYLLIDDPSPDQRSQAQQLLKHPALYRGLNGSEPIPLAGNRWLCPAPSMLTLALDLARALHVRSGQDRGHHD